MSSVKDNDTHLGRHTRVFADIVGPTGMLLAFEPLTPQFLALEALNLSPHVRLINAAVSDYSGRSAFVHARGTPSEGGLRGRIQRSGSGGATDDPCHVVCLDDFLDQIPSLHFAKIDVEGGEIGCPRGGRSRAPPVEAIRDA
jgi:FkbM family methyltransferase